jgi:UDP-3-O-[3-hydroxymyristoyl] glucosamine N-acyltransferase
MTLGELVEVLGGKLVAGEPERLVEGVNSVELAGATELVFAEDAASAAKALASMPEPLSSGAGVSLCCPTLGRLAASKDGAPSVSQQDKCVVEAVQPRLWFARAARLLKPASARNGSASDGGDWRVGGIGRRRDDRGWRGCG